MLDALDQALAPSGLSLRGGFALEAGESLEFEGLESVRTVLLVGNAGGAFWPTFQCWRAVQPRGLENPLDGWSRYIIGAVAAQAGARAVYPSDRPYMPFQTWAMRAKGLRPSPLGILMDPVCGPWHAYRGALLFDREISLPKVQRLIHLCEICVGKPCKTACPVSAHSGDQFAYQDCLVHVRGQQGADCRSTGCMDRNACPFGEEFRYPAEMQAFIMQAFSR